MTDREQVIAELEYMKRDVLEDSAEDITLNKAIALLKEQEAEIRQLRLALDIAKGTCNGIRVEGR